MRKNWNKKYITDPRKKKITTGYMGINDGKTDPKKKGKSQMKKTGHFVFFNPDTGEEFFPELRELYGDNAEELIVAFPSGNYADFFNDDFNLWTSTHNLRRRCDGDTCEHIIDEEITINGKTHKYKAGDTTECICKTLNLKEQTDKQLKNLACGCDMYLKAWIINPKTGKIIVIPGYQPFLYIFYTGSEHTADNLRSQFDVIRGFDKILFRLTTHYHTKEKRSYTLWEITPYLLEGQKIEYRYDTQFLPKGQALKLLSETTEQEQKILTTGEEVHQEVPIEAEYEDIPSDPADESQEVPESLFNKETKTTGKVETKSEAFMNFKFNIKKTFKEDILDSQISALKKSSLLSEDEKTELLSIAEDVRDFIKSSFK